MNLHAESIAPLNHLGLSCANTTPQIAKSLDNLSGFSTKPRLVFISQPFVACPGHAWWVTSQWSGSVASDAGRSIYTPLWRVQGSSDAGWTEAGTEAAPVAVDLRARDCPANEVHFGVPR